jgi:hypothetical protein
VTTLVSPGVDIEISDESFYDTAGQGTVPLIFIATADNKASPTGTGTAPYTSPTLANEAYIATSQRDLIQQFGNPNFYSLQGTPIHGDERNEYGLLAAYQYLGLANRAYIVRADIDLSQLTASVSAPRSAPQAGTYWLDLSTTVWGLFQSNGNKLPGAAWVAQPVLVVTADNATQTNGVYAPNPSFGTDGSFAVVTVSSDNQFWERIAGTWYLIGSTTWKAARPTTLLGTVNPAAVAINTVITINGTDVTIGGTGALTDVVSAINTAAIPSITASIVNSALQIQNTAGGQISIANKTGTPLTTLGIIVGIYNGVTVNRTNDAQYPANSSVGDVWIKGSTPNKGALWAVKYYNGTTAQWTSVTAPFYPYTSSKSDGDTSKDLAAFAGLGVPTVGNVYVGYDASTGVQQLRRWSGTQWEDLVYTAALVAPSSDPAAGTLWYNTDFQVDIMVGNGEKWEAYGRRYPETNAGGVILSGSAPVQQDNGNALVDNDLWIDTSDLDNYPALYRWSVDNLRWTRVDTTDQTTPFGCIFADARQDSGTAFTGMPNTGLYNYNSTKIADMMMSDFLDPDAPDPRVHPDGMLLFNTRYSTYNVKQWLPNYFKEGNFDPNTNFGAVSYNIGNPDYMFPPLTSLGRWVTASGNRYDGRMNAGRFAQRQMVVTALAAAINTNQDIRAENAYFNLICCPGYPEVLNEMVLLNDDQKDVSFIIGDSPARLAPDATSLQNWATNTAQAPSDGEEGLVTASPYVGIYYPWGYSTNVDGSAVMIPPSAIALRTYGYNDQVAYPWFAPAGFNRGLVQNATNVGYLTSEGEFKSVMLNQGQRDVLYTNAVNPIAFMPNRGLVVYGQKTRNPSATALDRVNVARLCNYLSYNLDNLMKPYLFEQNDQQTRDSVTLVVSRFLANLVTLRALEDYAVLCDETNNTPDRRDRNELWVDIAIQPIKAIEFIYVPVRVLASEATLSATGSTAATTTSVS